MAETLEADGREDGTEVRFASVKEVQARCLNSV